MAHRSASTADAPATLTDRYVHAATHRLPEDQRDDVADELRASLADRVESLLHDRPALSREEAERHAVAELGDPDRLAAGYSGAAQHVVGPELYPTYMRALKAVLLTVLPIVAVAVPVAETLTGASFGNAVGSTAWAVLTTAVHIGFWMTLVFWILERSGAEEARRELGGPWSPDQLPELPAAGRGSLTELVASLAFLASFAVVLVWQQVRPPVEYAGERVPVLDPGLWSFWLPLVLVLVAAEAAFELVKYRTGGWSVRLAAANVVVSGLFAAPVLYLAATDRLLNPDAVAGIREGWAAFDPDVASTVVLLTALAVWVWDSVDGWRRALR